MNERHGFKPFDQELSMKLVVSESQSSKGT
jgi:hypothetical protein